MSEESITDRIDYERLAESIDVAELLEGTQWEGELDDAENTGAAIGRLIGESLGRVIGEAVGRTVGDRLVEEFLADDDGDEAESDGSEESEGSDGESEDGEESESEDDEEGSDEGGDE
ncbi:MULTISPECIES: hypothetical protein [Saliphagus]|uniref:Uncharacterized protein n=1 Tax=Saliphagus infecundisoli TaxID=1849069 RepID=A0ABD5QFP3_9EURY|nr:MULTISPECIES: hypothetical protein [Saliphagus]